MTPFLEKEYDPKEMDTARGVLVRKRNATSLIVFQKGDVGGALRQCILPFNSGYCHP